MMWFFSVTGTLRHYDGNLASFGLKRKTYIKALINLLLSKFANVNKKLPDFCTEYSSDLKMIEMQKRFVREMRCNELYQKI